MPIRDLNQDEMEKDLTQLEELASIDPSLIDKKILWSQYRAVVQINHLIESLPSFAKDNDETEWRALADPGTQGYGEQELIDMRDQAEKLYYTDPSARGLIEAMVNFVIGKELTIVPEDEDEEVKAYWKHFWDLNRIDVRIKESLRRALKTGDCFLRFFDMPYGVDYINDFPVKYRVPLVRFVRPNEIKDPEGIVPFGVETDPDDIETPIQYIRSQPTSTGQIIREIIPADQMLHIKYLVDSDVKRGISFYVGIAKYIKKYAQWLEDRWVLNRMRTLFNLVMKVNGSPSAFAEKFETATTPAGSAVSTSLNTTQKRMPNRGSVLVSTPGIEYDFLNPNIKAQDTKDDGRAIELMLAKATGFTEYIVRGDASNANYASSMVSESPMVRTFSACQDWFEKPLKHMFRKVIRYGIEHGQIPARTKRTVITVNKMTGEETITEKVDDTNRDCSVNFEALIHRDVKDEAEAFAIHKMNGWDSDRGIITKLGNNPLVVDNELRREEIQDLERDRRMMEAAMKLEQQNNSYMRNNKNSLNNSDNAPPTPNNPEQGRSE